MIVASSKKSLIFISYQPCMNAVDFANFAVAWAGAGFAWVGAINTNRTSRADMPKVVATEVSLAGGVPVLEIANVGGKGAADIKIELDGAEVAFRGGLIAGGSWKLPIPSARDGSVLLVISLDASGNCSSEKYHLWSAPSGYRLTREMDPA